MVLCTKFTRIYRYPYHYNHKSIIFSVRDTTFHTVVFIARVVLFKTVDGNFEEYIRYPLPINICFNCRNGCFRDVTMVSVSKPDCIHFTNNFTAMYSHNSLCWHFLKWSICIYLFVAKMLLTFLYYSFRHNHIKVEQNGSICRWHFQLHFIVFEEWYFNWNSL